MAPRLTPIEKQKASEQIVEMLMKEILQGGFRPGDKLPAERTLAAQLNVTRATLREALKRLEQLKLVTIHQGKGIIVEDFHKASIDLIFSLMVIDGDIDLNILENIMESRLFFGGEVARLAAIRADDNDLEQMRLLLEEMDRTGDPVRIQQMDFEFFHLLATAGKNMVYILLMNTIKTIHDKHLNLFQKLAEPMKMPLKREIYEAVVNGDAEKAAEKARTFMQSGLDLLQSFKSALNPSSEKEGFSAQN